ncbi:SRPBCC domain-containing protein [uncultured Metabacillus sp.]|uniref:SRPBCC family protein n=1 Tax=uncultured Metabacillus sp. TaxID=2860135 RepID=UPI0026292B3E|nr:SRPBCC domain-containing protein [uncultured Metabacillus sp.]
MTTYQEQVPDIRKTVVFEAPIEKVWQAVSTAEGIAEWFMPNDFEPKVGHEFTLHSPYEKSPCKVLEIDPPNGLSFTWGNFGWKVSFELKDLDGKTEFTLIHTGWGAPDKVAGPAGETFAVIRNRMNNGWDGIVDERLRKVVEA